MHSRHKTALLNRSSSHCSYRATPFFKTNPAKEVIFPCETKVFFKGKKRIWYVLRVLKGFLKGCLRDLFACLRVCSCVLLCALVLYCVIVCYVVLYCVILYYIVLY